MGVTAEYAGGSSGSPVLDKRGAVVGMAALTLTIGDSQIQTRRGERRALLGRSPRAMKKQPPVAPPPREKGVDPATPPLHGSGIQMILKMAVPGPTILRRWVEEAPRPSELDRPEAHPTRLTPLPPPSIIGPHTDSPG